MSEKPENVQVRPEIRKFLKIVAAKSGLTVVDLLSALLECYIRDEKTAVETAIKWRDDNDL